MTDFHLSWFQWALVVTAEIVIPAEVGILGLGIALRLSNRGWLITPRMGRILFLAGISTALMAAATWLIAAHMGTWASFSLAPPLLFSLLLIETGAIGFLSFSPLYRIWLSLAPTAAGIGILWVIARRSFFG
jgi:hypothetical protein